MPSRNTISVFFLVSLLSSLRCDKSLFILCDALVSHPDIFSVISSPRSLPLLPPAYLNLIPMPHQIHRIEYWSPSNASRIANNSGTGEYLDSFNHCHGYAGAWDACVLSPVCVSIRSCTSELSLLNDPRLSSRRSVQSLRRIRATWHRRWNLPFISDWMPRLYGSRTFIGFLKGVGHSRIMMSDVWVFPS